jgi:hypothetical protein
MALQARQLAEANYDWPVAAQKLEAIYRELLANRTGALAGTETYPAAPSLSAR